MRILIDSGNYFANNDNQGDRAIYQIIARRLRHLWPDCKVRWITRNRKLLNTTCINVSPLVLTHNRYPLQAKSIKQRSGKAAIPRKILWRQPNSEFAHNTFSINVPMTDSKRILSALRHCDFVIATGGGYFNDCFPDHAWAILDTLEAAIRYGKPTFILSTGFEPIRNSMLLNKMLTVLPKINLITCREPTQSPLVVRSFGVKKQQVAIAGDDAVELAFEARPSSLGSSLGINLRKADYSGIDSNTIRLLQEGLQQIANKLGAPLIPLPISMSGPSDPDAICELLTGFPVPTDGGKYLNTPESVIKQAGHCRLVITGSYHAAVFALSQGISVVALAASPHYKAKLEGLKALFGAGCSVLMLNRNLTKKTLSGAIEEMWRQADDARPLLLEAAEQQIAASQSAYRQMHDIAESLIKTRQLPGPIHAIENIARSWNAFPPHDNSFNNSYKNVLLERTINFKSPFMQLTTSPASAQFTLSPKEIETFQTNGFLGPFTAYEPHEMERVQQVIYDRVLPTPTLYCPFGLRVRHIDSRTIYDLCSTPEIIGRIASLFGPDLILWNSNIFNKPPAEPGHMEEYPWHQDYYNWQMEPVLNISAWLAITPATPENGCVEVIPGSHKLSIPPVRDTDPHLSMRFGGVASDPAYIDEKKKVALTLKPGQFFLFNERILHHSNPNMTKVPRLGVAMRFTVPIVKISEPFPCILVSGKDEMGFNRYVDKPTDEPDMEWLASLPESHDFTFDRPIPGMGWHIRETDGTQNFAWTGLEPKAWIDFRPVDSGDHILRYEIIHMLSHEAIDNASASVNGYPVELRKQHIDKIVILEAHVPNHILQNHSNRVRVSLEVPELIRPCDINAASVDKRALGLGVRRISLLPAI